MKPAKPDRYEIDAKGSSGTAAAPWCKELLFAQEEYKPAQPKSSQIDEINPLQPGGNSWREKSDPGCGAKKALLGLHPHILGSTGNMSGKD